MDVQIATFSRDELERCHEAMSRASLFAKAMGHYQLAAQTRAIASLCNQRLLRLEADHRQMIARQLSLTPPGAYDEPA